MTHFTFYFTYRCSLVLSRSSLFRRVFLHVKIPITLTLKIPITVTGQFKLFKILNIIINLKNRLLLYREKVSIWYAFPGSIYFFFLVKWRTEQKAKQRKTLVDLPSQVPEEKWCFIFVLILCLCLCRSCEPGLRLLVKEKLVNLCCTHEQIKLVKGNLVVCEGLYSGRRKRL